MESKGPRVFFVAQVGISTRTTVIFIRNHQPGSEHAGMWN